MNFLVVGSESPRRLGLGAAPRSGDRPWKQKIVSWILTVGGQTGSKQPTCRPKRPSIWVFESVVRSVVVSTSLLPLLKERSARGDKKQRWSECYVHSVCTGSLLLFTPPIPHCPKCTTYMMLWRFRTHYWLEDWVYIFLATALMLHHLLHYESFLYLSRHVFYSFTNLDGFLGQKN